MWIVMYYILPIFFEAEAGATIVEYLPTMQTSRLFCVCVGGFASCAGSNLIQYRSFGVSLLRSCFSKEIILTSKCSKMVKMFDLAGTRANGLIVVCHLSSIWYIWADLIFGQFTRLSIECYLLMHVEHATHRPVIGNTYTKLYYNSSTHAKETHRTKSFFGIWHLNVHLTFEWRTLVLHATHRVQWLMVNMSTRLLWNPSMQPEDIFWHLISKCELDLLATDLVLSCDTIQSWLTNIRNYF